jgi:hypothetical protein
MKFSATIRRSTAILAVAVGMLAITGPANAAGSLPSILSGKADSQALRIQLTLPGLDQLKSTLQAAGVDLSSLPSTGVGGVTIDEKLSLNHGEVLRNIKGAPDRSAGFATAITGMLPVAGDLTKSAESSCSTAGCTPGTPIAAVDTDLTVPTTAIDLGHLKLAGAESVTKNLLDTRNVTALATAHIDLASLIGPKGPLSAVGDALRTLTSTVNNTVLPPVNGALSTLEGSLGDALAQNAPALKKQLDNLVSVGTVKPLPDLITVSLADLTILGAKANVSTATVNGFKGVLAQSASKVADVKLLGGWAGLDAVGISTSSFANGHKGGAASSADSQIAGLNLGGALGLNIDGSDLQNLANPKALEKAISDAAASAGLQAQAQDLIGAIDLLYNISGIDVQFFGQSHTADKLGRYAQAQAGTLALIVEPKIPVMSSMVTLPGHTVPTFTKFASTGIRLRVDLPNASTAVAAGNVLGTSFTSNPVTGVGMPIFAAFVLLGAALVIRKFVLSK